MAKPAYPLELPEREDTRSWPAQGEWTYEDYCLLPGDGRRYEVVRGHLYVSPARDAGVPEVWFANPQQKTIVVYGLSEDGKSCVEISRSGDGGAVESRVLPGLRVPVSEIFSQE